MTKRTRYKITIISGIALVLLAYYSAKNGLESMGITCIGGLMTILTTYIWGETKRPSKRNRYDT